MAWLIPLTCFLAAREVGAEPATHPASDDGTASEPLGVRMAASPEAEERLGSVRLRRLLKIELEGTAQVEPSPTGSLSGDLIRVWIHVPSSRRAVIEVRRNGRPLARRTLAIATFPADVAARVVAIEASEMVRVQARAVARPPTPPAPASPSRGDDDGQAIALAGGLGATFTVEGAPVAFLGPDLALSHRIGLTSQRLYARWHASLDDPATRWLEVGAGFDLRFALHPDWRLRAGVAGGAVHLAFPSGTVVFGEPAGDALTARVGGEIAIERRLTPDLWLALAVAPGGLLRSVDYAVPHAPPEALGGFVLGASLAVIHPFAWRSSPPDQGL